MSIIPDVHAFTFPQIVGYIALAASILSYTVKDDNRMKLSFTGANLIWIAHYILIGTFTSGVATAIVTFRNVISLNSPRFSKSRKLLSLLLIEGMLVASCIHMWSTWQQATPFIPTMLGTWAIFYLHGVRLRQAFFICDIFWLLNGVVVGSVGGVIYAVGSLGMNTITMLGMSKAIKRAEMARIENLP